ncbi:Imm10 family immunity protein [Actinophytocola sediminis]
MRLTAAEVGYFEDYQEEEALEVGIIGIDELGVRRSLSFQRSSFDEPDQQDVENEMDSYNISTERGFTIYGGLRSVRLARSQLTVEFAAEDARILGITTPVEVDLSGSGADLLTLSAKLRNILDWGAQDKRPEMIGL